MILMHFRHTGRMPILTQQLRLAWPSTGTEKPCSLYDCAPCVTVSLTKKLNLNSRLDTQANTRSAFEQAPAQQANSCKSSEAQLCSFLPVATLTTTVWEWSLCIPTSTGHCQITAEPTEST
jgi:hypothetical protein